MRNSFLKNWWNGLKYDPQDPRFLAGGEIKIVVIGGGTGLANLLRGLRNYSSQITAIVTVADNGSSSGELRKEYDILPPGDIRKCISALAHDEETVSQLLEYRFKRGKSFSGHTLGNIWLTALSQYFGSFEKAIEATTEIFQTAGKVLPSSLGKIELCIEYEDGTVLEGESNLDRFTGRKIKRVFLNKKNVKAYKKACLAIDEAEMIVIGPGSLYGSVIPNLLISGIRKSIKQNRSATKVFVANCSTERTQTENYSVEDHIRTIYNHTNSYLFDYCLVNKTVLRRSSKEWKLGEVNNITTTKKRIMRAEIIGQDLISETEPLYHDSDKLAKCLINLYNNDKGRIF